MSDFEQAEAWGEAQAMARIATLTVENERLTAEVATYKRGWEGAEHRIRRLEPENEALRADLAGAMAEIRRLDPHIQHPDGTGFDTALLTQPFDLAAHQERMAREWLTATHPDLFAVVEEREKRAALFPAVGPDSPEEET